VAIGLAVAVISTLAAAGRREEKASSRVIFLRLISIVVGAVTLLIWVLMDSFNTGYMYFINGNTLIVGIFFAATIVVSAIANAFEKKKEEADTLAL
jgi:Zn-dependent protease with chaperone function